ncbi:DUF2889 domain-containing protein [Aromatoleum anaerobium]|uniref:DUF2889 domain-containing protein n=1 Tax=Aromatoleum anaerobium TaxID=182180 RepID=A0ABX1PKW3_9RHOO|nr:DUF2889 domain-containing protein [Aromatoleum anaerobium]MCK0508121.1 DUF2889 domain-containing protein [Aromatoleum anaerobium]
MARPNPLYGTGIFRRRIRLQAAQGQVSVDLEDGNHGFRLRLWHDGERVTTVEVDPLRIPFNTCAEAQRPLQRVIGHRLDEDDATLRSRLVPGDNCTHLYDMAVLAVAHAAAHLSKRRGDGITDDGCTTCLYDMEVDDERDGVTRARIACNGQPVHDWAIAQHTLHEPAEHAGRPVMRGFHAWASKSFSGMPREAAFALQRAYFVAQARRHSFEPAAEHPGASDGMPQGACYSYNTGVVERAFRSNGTVRDFTDSPELLLKFLP